jgi:replicative DNA helicase
MAQALERAPRLSHFNSSRTIEKLRHFRQNPGSVPGIETGFPRFDRKLGGLRKQTYTILAARPKVGKSGFVFNIVLNVAMRGLRVAYFSLEMSEYQLQLRGGSILSGIPSQAYLDGYRYEGGAMVPLLDEDYDLFERSVSYLSELPIGLHVGGISTDEMWSVLEGTNAVDLVVVDHIGLHTDMPSASPYQRVKAITKAHKEMKLRFEVPILGVAQLSRSVESREDKRPQISDTRDSGSIEEDADAIVLMYRPDYYAPEEDEVIVRPSDVEVNIAANRDGPTGVVHFTYDRATQRFSERGQSVEQGIF